MALQPIPSPSPILAMGAWPMLQSLLASLREQRSGGGPQQLEPICVCGWEVVPGDGSEWEGGRGAELGGLSNGGGLG